MVIPSSQVFLESSRECLDSLRLLKRNTIGGLKNRHLFLPVLVAGKSKIKVLADSVPAEGSLPGLYMAAFSLCAPVAFPWCMHVRDTHSVFPPLLKRPEIFSLITQEHSGKVNDMIINHFYKSNNLVIIFSYIH